MMEPVFLLGYVKLLKKKVPPPPPQNFMLPYWNKPVILQSHCLFAHILVLVDKNSWLLFRHIIHTTT